MASITVNRGLQVIGGRASNTADAFLEIDTMAVDDKATAFLAADTNLATPTNLFAQLFDAVPARTNQTVAHIMTLATGNGNFTIRRFSLHNTTPASNVTNTSVTLVSGIDGQSLTKTTDFTLRATINHTYTSV